MSAAQTDTTKKHIFDEFNSAVDETEQLIRSATALGGDTASGLVTSLEKSLASVRDRLSRLQDESIYQVNAAARTTDRYVRENPWQTVGIVAALAAVTGMIAGMLIARR